MSDFQRIRVLDSHTAGEPTRVILTGGPELGSGPLADRLRLFRERFDDLRRTVILEPRGSDVLVGALLCEPVDRTCTAGVIFFNNVGYLGMCGHGMIGVVATLAYLNRIQPGEQTLETPVGRVVTTLQADGRVSITNVPSYRLAKDITVPVEGHGDITGDVVWGGNWFYLVERHGEEISFANVERLTALCCAIRDALARSGVAGANGAEIDHIELFGPPATAAADSKNFVLCPGRAYDRSPCGTGTSAKLACLLSDGKLQPGQIWRQEGILGTIFEGQATMRNDQIIPTIIGRGYITAEATLLLDPADPFRHGIISGEPT
ncbi:MAG: proline racemase family protein [Pirellulales bacterium]